MNYQLLPNCEKSEADIIVLPISYEDSVSAKVGTKDAPKAVLEASVQLEYYEEDLQWSPMKYIKLHVEKEIVKNKTQSVEEFISYLKKTINSASSSSLLISLGGEHSITPMICSERLKNKATVIFLDAHADLRESYQGSKYSHATPAFQLLEQGHKLVMVGIRSIFEKEAQIIKENENISFFSDRALQKQSKKDELLKLISNLEGEVYLSVDMDAFSPSFVPSVGTPQPGGLDWYIALDILEALFFNEKVKVGGVDFVEMIPDDLNISQIFTAKLMQKVISYWGKSQKYDLKPMSGSQSQMEYE